jgi:hypothetical protein
MKERRVISPLLLLISGGYQANKPEISLRKVR